MSYRMKSEKEKQISYVNGMCGVQKNGIAGLICKGEIETQRERTNIWMPQGLKRVVGGTGKLELAPTHYRCYI